MPASITPHHLDFRTAIMDSGNNKQHCFKHKGYFPLGVTWHRVNITGVHGSKVVNVGVGVAYFCMKCVDGSWLLWVTPNSLYNPASPVNLLCVDIFHYRPNNTKTGHRVDFFDECMYMSDGKKVRVKRDSVSKLPLVELREVDAQVVRERKTKENK